MNRGTTISLYLVNGDPSGLIKVCSIKETYSLDLDDVNMILFDGTKKQIQSLRCPDCRGRLQFHFYPEIREFYLRCIGECGHIELCHKTDRIPNCFKFFGNSPNWSFLDSKFTKPLNK